MRTNRTTLAAMLSIALAVVPGAVAVQSADEQPATASHWTGTDTEGQGFPVPDGETGYFDWGYRTTVGKTYTVEADDPRAAGVVSVALVIDFADNGISRGVGPGRLVNEGGSWEGTVHFFGYPDGSMVRMALMDGQDGYAGLSYSMTNFISPSGEEQAQGLIWEGDVPQLSAADALPE